MQAAGQPLPDGRLSLVLQMGDAVDLAQPLAGLLIDEWVEVVPSAQRDDGDRVPVRPARCVRAPGDPARGAAGDGAPWTVGGLNRCCSRR